MTDLKTKSDATLASLNNGNLAEDATQDTDIATLTTDYRTAQTNLQAYRRALAEYKYIADNLPDVSGLIARLATLDTANTDLKTRSAANLAILNTLTADIGTPESSPGSNDATGLFADVLTVEDDVADIEENRSDL